VRAIELELLNAIFAARKPDDWSSLDIILVSRLAAQLAACMKDEEHLRRSGSLIRSPKNSAYAVRNPLLDAVATRSAQVGQMLRTLGLAVPAIDRRQLAASAHVLEATRVFDDDSDGLFARPQ
jgi:phage terminase small subunit